MKPLSRQAVHAITGILFVISGALGLFYQILWFKYLSLFLGNTTYAQTIVLATFMGGLAIGSAWWGRKVDKTAQPLKLYALLELGIGLYCLIYPKFLNVLENAFISIVVSAHLPSDGQIVLLLKLLLSLCSLLFPTILMGGTLPVLVRFLSRSVEESGKNVAVLYFLNSLGAVIGTVLAGFFFIRILGMSATVYTAAVVNLCIGGFAMILCLAKIEPKNGNTNEPEEPQALFSHNEERFAILVAGISGLAAMIYEVTWVRVLILILGSSTYSFSLMLVACISGITIGSYIISVLIKKVKNLSALLAWCQVGVVLSMIVTLPFYMRIPYEFWKVASFLTHSDATYTIFLSIQFFFCFALMIVPTIFLGMSLPVATRIASRTVSVLGKSVGTVFAVNTLGTVIGSLLAGLALIPLVGVKHTFEIGIGCNLLAAMIIILWSGSFARRHMIIAFSIVAFSLLSYAIFVPSWNSSAMLSGVFRRIHSNTPLPSSYSDFINNEVMRKVLFYKEGTMATVGVVENGTKSEIQRSLIINGKVDASSKGDLQTQILLGQIPCLLHQNPQSALVIGLGSGTTIGSILSHPIKRVDCVEISPEVVGAVSLFDDVNHHALQDPRTNLSIEDALAYLKITPHTYDLIVSEPSNPWIAGIGNLYTTDYYKECKQRMNAGGLMVQWFHLYEMSDDLFKMVVRTFQTSFSNVSIWQPQGNDVIMIGSDRTLTVDFDKIKAAIAMQHVKEDLQRIDIPDAATLLSLEMLSPKSVLQYVSVGDLNTEDNPRLEYNAPKAFFLGSGVSDLSRLDERLRCDSVSNELKRRLDNRLLTDEELYHIGFFHTKQQSFNLRFGYAILRTLLTRHQKDVLLLERLAQTAETINLPDDAISYYKNLAELEPNSPTYLEKYAWLKYTTERNYTTLLTPVSTKESEGLLNTCITITVDTVDRYHFKLAEMYYGTQRYAKAAEHYARTFQIRTKYEGDASIHDDVLYLQLARCLNKLGKNDRALAYALSAVNVNPKNEEAKDLFYELWTKGMNSVKSK